MYWDFIDSNGNRHVIEKDTADQADEYAQNWFAERCEATRYGQTFADIGWLVELDEEGAEIRRIETALEYEHERCDREEHGTW